MYQSVFRMNLILFSYSLIFCLRDDKKKLKCIFKRSLRCILPFWREKQLLVSSSFSFGDLPPPPLFSQLPHLSCLQVENIVAAEYELEHLLLEGHCFDVSSGQPPRGLQFTLGTASEPVIVDTIVMANLVSYRFNLSCLVNHINS